MLFQGLQQTKAKFSDECLHPMHHKCSFVPEIIRRLKLFNQLSDELIEFESNHVFIDELEEISYYKEHKPEFLKYGIFYKNIFSIMKRYPVGLKKGSKQYQNSCLKEINDVFKLNIQMFEYLRAEYNHDDKIIFKRNSSEKDIFALLQATIMTENFIHNLSDSESIEDKLKNFSYIEWTGTKIEAVQLAYVLLRGKKINNGNATIKEVIDYFQLMFHIDLKDYYKKFKDVIDSEDPFKFLDYLKDVLQAEIDKSLK